MSSSGRLAIANRDAVSRLEAQLREPLCEFSRLPVELSARERVIASQDRLPIGKDPSCVHQHLSDIHQPPFLSVEWFQFGAIWLSRIRIARSPILLSMSETRRCAICAQHELAEQGTDPWAVARLQSGYVRLNANQYFAGSSFFATCACVDELHQLEFGDRDAHLIELGKVSEAVYNAFEPKGLNLESVGNVVTHLRWWLVPRRVSDARPADVIWQDMGFWKAQWTESNRPDDTSRVALQRRLLKALEASGVVIEKAFAS